MKRYLTLSISSERLMGDQARRLVAQWIYTQILSERPCQTRFRVEPSAELTEDRQCAKYTFFTRSNAKMVNLAIY